MKGITGLKLLSERRKQIAELPMRIKLAGYLLTVVALAGCDAGRTPSPVPSNTPIPSASDLPPAEPSSTSSPSKSGEKQTSEPETAPPALPTEIPSTQEQSPTNPANLPAKNSEATNEITPKQSAAPGSPLEQELAQLSPEQLVERLSDEPARDLATRQLVAKGTEAVEPLLKALDHSDWQIRAVAVFTLGQLGADANPALPKLKELAASDQAPAVRDAAAFAVDSIQP
jgi:hypothetical protein